jgi:fermentation-respiration switch protein FrsA (DUF1100 family)
VYSRIGEAIGNRLAARFGDAGRVLVPLMTLQLEPRLGVSEEALSPLDRIAGMRAPLLVLGGGDDRRTRPDETRALHRRAPVPKSLWIVDGAGHQDLHAFAREGYERRVLEFFEAHR